MIVVGSSMIRLTTMLAVPREAAPKPSVEATHRHWAAGAATTSRRS
ncbi:hypothetical protein MPTA5024_07710 [Microbispora sp. ATCC PTA-5024]|nr:hypothetical protein MPTA5024_07710 [Microbispora sp. ATCC PTA-5024]